MGSAADGDPAPGPRTGQRSGLSRLVHAGRTLRGNPRRGDRLVSDHADIDVRNVLPAIRVPTLVMHRTNDGAIPVEHGRYLAEQIPVARYVELPGADHFWFAGDMDAILGEIQEFLTGIRPTPEPDRVLATIMFTDIVGSTQRAAPSGTGAGRTSWRATTPWCVGSWGEVPGTGGGHRGRRVPGDVRRTGKGHPLLRGHARSGRVIELR
jgi:hypothetical protein